MIGMNSSQLRGVIKRQGFTIVELLVVIAVVGILSVITTVSYLGITQRANIAKTQVELESAYKKLSMFYTENNTYPIDLSAAKTAGLIPTDSKTNEIYVADNSVNPAYYCYSFTTGTETYAIDSSSSVSKGGCLTNLITNGDFSNGTTGWGASGGSITASGGVLRGTASGIASDSTAFSWFSPVILTSSNHIIYARASARVTNSECATLRFTVASNLGIKSFRDYVVNPTENVWYFASGTVSDFSSFTGTSLRVYISQFYINPTAATNKNMEVDNVLCIDLTATFGAGNEPTATQMDAMLAEYPDSWFDGTKKGSLFW